MVLLSALYLLNGKSFLRRKHRPRWPKAIVFSSRKPHCFALFFLLHIHLVVYFLSAQTLQPSLFGFLVCDIPSDIFAEIMQQELQAVPVILLLGSRSKQETQEGTGADFECVIELITARVKGGWGT
jgi:hypothetical protein